jgi:hypothetical protein
VVSLGEDDVRAFAVEVFAFDQGPWLGASLLRFGSGL